MSLARASLMTAWGAIFDWDGVIIDSARQHETAWQCLATEQGHAWPPDAFRRGFGLKNDRIIGEILGWETDPMVIERLSRRKEVIYRDILRAHGIEPLPGVRPWLETLAGAGVRCAIASSTERANIDYVLDRLGLQPYFAAIVSADDVRSGKPDPAVFLLAAERLGAAPHHCVVFEDALAGIEAGRAAGMKVVAVATTHPPAALRAADHVVLRLDQLDLRVVAGWFDDRIGPKEPG